jgi:hypothetical protein
MAVIEDPTGASQAKVDAGSMRGAVVARGAGFGLSVNTGTIAAAIAAGSPVFAMRLNPSAGTTVAEIDRVRIKYTTIAAFTVPVTAGRTLTLVRGSGAAASGGTAVAAVAKKSTTFGASQFDTASGGDVRVSTTGALTATGITFESVSLRGCTLSHVGAAGGYFDCIWEFADTECYPVVVAAGQVLAVRVPTLFDAAGTWQLQVDVDWREAVIR